MPLMTGRQYIDSLERMKPLAYLFGERMEQPWEHPFVKPSQNAIALTYDLAHDPQFADLMTAHSPLIDGPVNRFTHIYQGPDDLVKKVKMARLMGQKTATCFQRCTTMDTANALHIATFEIDQELGTNYHQRFLNFLREVQEKDLNVGVAMTDVKGDRSLRPSQQSDPDLYLRIVKEKSDGILVRGAKAHQSGSLNCHYTLVAPTAAMREEERDYTVAFAVPSDEKGIIHVYGRQFSDTRKLEGATIDVGNPRYGAQETLLIFDDVFVPWERVFLCREYQFAGRIPYLFGSNHRQTYGGCKAGVSDVLIGAVAQLAEYQGIAGFPHVRDKLLEMVALTETIYSCGLAAAIEGQQMSSGIYFSDLLLGNVCLCLTPLGPDSILQEALRRSMQYFIGTDIGGTFTDVVVLDEEGRVSVAKAPSTPPNFAQGLMDALAEAAAQVGLPLGELLAKTRLFSHGCTVATNTLINRSGCRVGLITSRGFEETLFIMRGSAYCQGLPVEYWYRKPQNERPFDIVPLDRIAGVSERIDRTGSIVVALNEEEMRQAAHFLVKGKGCDALTVGFLWSFVNPTHEQKARRIIAEMFPECTVSISSEIAPMIGEYERFSTAVLNAYLRPEVEAYVHDLRGRLAKEGLAAPILLMQANGGLIPWEEAAWQAVRMLQSGPTGGVIAGKIIGDLIGSQNVITTDMGGTSYDISLVTGGKLNYATKSYHQRHVVATPMVDIESIGAGGGSIAYIEQGVMKVGPQSAGADPGPVCYGKGGRHPTVTDANLLLGYLNPDYFIGGRLKLDVEMARKAIQEQLAEPLNLETVEAAYGIHRIVNAHMSDATRFHVLNRGYDPRDFDLLLFGGAAGLHATAIGEELGTKRIIIPLAGLATVLSAFGIVNSDVVRLHSASASMPLAAEKMEELEAIYAGMEERGRQELARDGFSPADIRTTRIAGIRYHLQLTEVDVEPLPDRLDASSAQEIIARFDRRYAELYGENAGYKEAGRDVLYQFVRAEARTPKVKLGADGSSPSEPDRFLKGRREAYFPAAGGWISTRIYDGDGLEAGSQIAGPAILEMVGTTVVVPPGYRAELDAYRNIHLRREN